MTEETSDKDGLYKIIKTKVVRNHGEKVKILQIESYPKNNSVKNCKIVFYDLTQITH